ncbi:MAG: hypothetical protein AAF541_04660 [Pseudomonadota bacterium]
MAEGVVDQIRAAGGEVYAITSEPQHLADQAHQHWELNFENVGDPHQEISRTCSERGWLTLYANRGDLEFLQRGAKWKVEHPKGYFQPGVLAITQEQRILYRWRSIPSAANMQGTLARPTATHVWKGIESALSSDTPGSDATLDMDPELDSKPAPRPLFLAFLVANGWFLGVRSLAYSPGVKHGPGRFARLLARWVPFIALWIVALYALPAVLVGTVFAGWVVWIVRDAKKTLGKMDRQTELVPDSEIQVATTSSANP